MQLITAMQPANAYRVVLKNSLRNKLFETDQANLIEIFDADTNLVGILLKAVNGQLWQVSLQGDPDFESFARQNGYKTATIIHPGTPTIHGTITTK